MLVVTIVVLYLYYVGIKTCVQFKPCNFTSENVGATMSGIVLIKSGYENDLQAAVASIGPVAVSVDASSSSFRVYIIYIFNTSALTNICMTYTFLGIHTHVNMYIHTHTVLFQWDTQYSEMLQLFNKPQHASNRIWDFQ